MGAADDYSPDRHRSKRHRHDSRDPPDDRQHRPSRDRPHDHQESSRHGRERSRDRSRELSRHGEDRRHEDRTGYEEDRREQDRELDRSGHPSREGRQHDDYADRRSRSDRHHSSREEQRGDDSHQEQRRDRQKRPERDEPLHNGQALHRENREDSDRGYGDRSRQQQQQGPRRPDRGRPTDGGGGRDGGKQQWGKPEDWEDEAAPPPVPKEGPNMGLSGKLAAETNKTVDGTAQLKYQPPPEARVCKQPPWRLYVFKGEAEAAAPITLNQTPFYLFGKDRKVADIPTDHPSCSRQHAVLCFREVEVDAPDGLATRRVVKPYLMDLESVNGTTINKEKLEGARYYELLHMDVMRFGLSSREYVIMNEATI